jgi:2TM domain
METINKNSEQYQLAKKQVGERKGFYIHLFIYLIVNVCIIVSNYNYKLSIIDAIFSWSTLGTAVFWGIGLASHWSRVFGKNLLFNKDWEEKKIKEFMETKTSNKWK